MFASGVSSHIFCASSSEHSSSLSQLRSLKEARQTSNKQGQLAFTRRGNTLRGAGTETTSNVATPGTTQKPRGRRHIDANATHLNVTAVLPTSRVSSTIAMTFVWFHSA